MHSGFYTLYGTRSNGNEWLIEHVGTVAELHAAMELFADQAPLRYTYTGFRTLP